LAHGGEPGAYDYGMRIVISLAVIGAATFAASAAEAAVSGGTFTGKTAAKDPIGLTVGAGSRITNLYFEGVHLKCTDEDEYDTLKGQYRMQANSKARIAGSGRWTVKKTTHDGASTWTASGKFSKGRRSTGTLTIKQRFNIENKLDPKGTIRCDSGKVKFTVTRR
jgi:hypothetical protein